MNTNVVNNKSKINIVLNDRNKKVEEKQTNRIRYETESLHLIDEKLSKIIGLDDVKEIVKEIYANMLINEKRVALGLATNKQVLHMIFKGNPGTGKTTIARELGVVLRSLNVLSKGHFIEAERADIVGEYIGQTAQKTRAIVQKALGGVLFIDEAYSLIRGGHKDFGREAIDTLVKQMEDYKDDFVLILAGYPTEMNQFLIANPGLKSRFPFHIHFKDYSVRQLIQIAKQLAFEREYELSEEAVQKLRFNLQYELRKNNRNFSNARYVRNIIEKSIRMQAIRLLHENEFDLKRLTRLEAEDITLE